MIDFLACYSFISDPCDNYHIDNEKNENNLSTQDSALIELKNMMRTRPVTLVKNKHSLTLHQYSIFGY